MTARSLQITALILFGLVTILMLTFGVSELAIGDINATGHLITAVILVGLLVFTAKYPTAAGWVLLAAGTLVSLYFFDTVAQPDEKLSAAMISGGPLLLIALLLLAAARVSHPKLK